MSQAFRYVAKGRMNLNVYPFSFFFVSQGESNICADTGQGVARAGHRAQSDGCRCSRASCSMIASARFSVATYNDIVASWSGVVLPSI